MRNRHLSAAALYAVFMTAAAFPLRGQSADLAISAKEAEGRFGSPAETALGLEKYLQTGAILAAAGGEVPSVGEGILLFAQNKPLLSGSAPRAEADFIAIAHDGGFVSVYSSATVSPKIDGDRRVAKGEILGSLRGAPGSKEASYILRIRDGTSGLWVNPVLFIGGLNDRTAPKIEELALTGQNGHYKAETQKKLQQRMPQGNYKLAVRVFDPSSYAGGSVSGVYRLKAVFDGQVVADRKFDSAHITGEGLNFLELGAPSSALADDEGRLLLGGQFLARGMHALEFSVYDYAGNSNSLTWKFTVE